MSDSEDFVDREDGSQELKFRKFDHPKIEFAEEVDDYSWGVLSIGADRKYFAVAPVLRDPNGAHVFALPAAAWPRRKNARLLEQSAVVKVKEVSVPAVATFGGGSDVNAPQSIKVALVIFAADALQHLGFAKAELIADSPQLVETLWDLCFVPSKPLVWPLSDELVDAAKEIFETGFATAASGAPASAPAASAAARQPTRTTQVSRLAALEARLAAMEAAQSPTPVLAPPTPKTAAQLLPPSGEPAPALVGLRSELASLGLNADQRQQLQAVLVAKGVKLAPEPPANSAARPRQPPQSRKPDYASDDELGGAGGEDVEVAALPDDASAMQKALIELTTITKALVGSRGNSRKNPLDLLGGGAHASTVESWNTAASSSSAAPRQHATARRLLERALLEDPSSIYEPIESKVKELNAIPVPAGAEPSLNARFWCEQRSRITSHRPTVNIVWIVSKIWELLSEANAPDVRVQEARARCALLCAALEQANLDRGDWSLAWELCLETREPPMASFDTHRGDSSRLPTTEIVDPRLLELAMSKIKETEDFLARKRNVAQYQNPYRPSGAAADPKKKPKGPGKGKPDASPPQ
eukprot:TRINITY_DN3486_c0_g2_i1.p2 TRINITY_DN3486_c0_g2~~TRINITY_DN3486_c0_g2_i1.p2  ORF type:complete len:585 (-),score=93.25 TRINITY_DN3486_c0_g2_i1:740-2494(-)